MEPRLLLSAATASTGVAHLVADPHYTNRAAVVTGDATTYPGSSVPYGKSPTTIRSAYGLGAYGSTTITFNGVQANGAGQTIALIDAYNYPSALTDLNAFSTYFGLPTLTNNTSLSTLNVAAGPTFSKISQTGSFTTLPGTDPNGPTITTGYEDAEEEESLDIEWAHVMAPEANIVLVECNSMSYADLLSGGVTLARSISGVVAISMSFGGNEFSGQTSYDSDFTSPTGHVGGAASAGGTEITGGVTFLASAGDSGAYASGTTTIDPQYPAASPNVVAVGGTTLETDGNTYVSESAWGNGTSSGTEGGGGGGISTVEAQPSYQASTVSAFSTTKRTYPDLSIEADPDTGVPIYDSYDYGTSTPWVPGYEGGTSLASPLVAGLVAVADQDRAINGLGSLDGKTGTLPAIYSISRSDYNDITTGNNGYAAGTGYDLATGIGSPIANLWVPAIAGLATTSVGTVTGEVFRDDNANGTVDTGDTGLAGVTVYLDENKDSVHQSTEPEAVTNSSGVYTFTGVAAGVTGIVRPLAVPTGYVTDDAPTFTVTSGGTSTANVGLFPTAYTDAAGSDAWTVRASPTASTTLQILVNGTVTYTAPTTLAPSLSFTFTGTADAIAVDFGNGVPATTVGVNGTAAADGDALTVLGTTGADTISASATAVVFGSSTITYASIPNLSVEPRTGTDSLTVTGGTVNLPAQTAGDGYLARSFSKLSVASGAKLVVGSAAAATDRTVVIVTTPANLTVAGQLDLGSNAIIVRDGTLSTVAALVDAGYASGTWAGTGGIDSSVAAANTAHTTALATELASSSASPTSFDGQTVAGTDVLVKYTYYGDVNLDGVVNAADYINVDVGFAEKLTGWANGDVNYDGVVDGSDYTLIDNAFNQQSGML
jgi:hypothetical protein